MEADFLLSAGLLPKHVELRWVWKRTRKVRIVGEVAFQRECEARGWAEPMVFLRTFEETACLIGEQVTLTDRQFRRWRQPNPPRPRPKAWRVLHAMFGISPLDLGFPGPAPGATVRAEHTQGREEGSVDRRAFVADTIGAAVGIPLGSDGAVGTAHVGELNEALRSLYALDDTYGSGDVRSLAKRHLCRIRRVISTGTYPDSIGRQLHLLAGETAEHCAWLHFDAVEHEQARQYWGEALTTATMLGDDSLKIMVLASMSLQALREDRPRDGYDFACAARQLADRTGSPTVLSLVATREARALAQMQDHRTARRALAESMRLLGRADRGRPAPAWAAFHCHAELEFVQGLLHAEAGHYKVSVPFMRAALIHQDRAYGRNHALYRLTLAQSLVHAGEVDEGAAEAVSSLEHVSEVASGRVMQRLVEVRQLLASADTASARMSVEALTEYTA